MVSRNEKGNISKRNSKKKLNPKYEPKHKKIKPKFKPSEPKEAPVNTVRNSIWIIFGVLILIGFGIASTTVSNSPSGYLTSDNITINNTGFYGSGQKVFVRNFDYVFCQSPTNDNRFNSRVMGCDYVCGVNDCGVQIESILNNNNYSSILFRNSISAYNITTRIDFNGRSDLSIIGEGSKTIFNMGQGIDILFRTIGNSSNIEFGNFKINKTTTATLIVGIAFDEPGQLGSNNIYIHDIDFGNIGWLCWRMATSTAGTTSYFTNLKMERLSCNNASFTMGQINHGYMDKIQVIGKSPYNNVLADIGFADTPGVDHVLDMHISNSYFVNDNPSGTYGGIAHGSNTTIFYDNIYCRANGSCITFGPADTTSHAEITISNSYFEGTGHANYNLIGNLARDSTSFIKVINSHFDGGNFSQNAGIGVVGNVYIIGNTFKSFGQKCLGISSASGIIEGNTFIDCAQTTASWRYVNIASSSKLYIKNNHFKSTNPSTTTVYALNGVNYSSIFGDTYENINSTSYYTFFGSEWNTTYLQDYKYTTLPYCDSESYNPFYLKTIYNGTDQFTCDSGVWKAYRNWNQLYNFPNQCPEGQYVTNIGGTLTCTPATYPNSSGTYLSKTDQSLLFLMHFDNMSILGENATYVYDHSIYNNNGTIIGSSNLNYLSNCKFGGCYNWTGNAGYVTVPNNILFNVTQFSIGAWFYWIGTNCNGECPIISRSNPSSTAQGYRLYTGSNFVNFGIGNGSERGIGGSANCNPTTKGWHHAIGTYNSSGWQSVYLDGRLCQNISSPNYVNFDRALEIGYRASWNYYYNGSIDEVFLMNRTMNPSEVQQLYYSKKQFYDTHSYDGLNLVTNNIYAKNVYSDNNNPIKNIIYNLGSSTLRWLKLWVKDIDASGNITMSNNDSIIMESTNNHYIKYNGSCIVAVGTGQTGNCL